MVPVLVGSRALEYWDPEFKPRENSDWDFLIPDNITQRPTTVCGQRLEYHNFSELNNGEICDVFAVDVGMGGHPDFPAVFDYKIMSPEGLALMKRSHLWRAYHFDKHITMYHKYLADYALWANLTWSTMLRDRVKLTKEAYPQRNPDLTQTNKDFFDDAVKKIFDHDWIHELVAYYDRPLFERLKKPEKFEKAWCEGDLWAQLSSDDKNKCVAEEAHVIACERFMIPSNWTHDPKFAYFKAMNKVCTTLCSGWFRDHAIDHFPQIISLYNPDKFCKVKEATNDKP